MSIVNIIVNITVYSRYSAERPRLAQRAAQPHAAARIS